MATNTPCCFVSRVFPLLFPLLFNVHKSETINLLQLSSIAKFLPFPSSIIILDWIYDFCLLIVSSCLTPLTNNQLSVVVRCVFQHNEQRNVGTCQTGRECEVNEYGQCSEIFTSFTCIIFSSYHTNGQVILWFGTSNRGREHPNTTWFDLFLDQPWCSFSCNFDSTTRARTTKAWTTQKENIKNRKSDQLFFARIIGFTHPLKCFLIFSWQWHAICFSMSPLFTGNICFSHCWFQKM